MNMPFLTCFVYSFVSKKVTPVNYIDPTGLRKRGEVITNGQGSYDDI